MNLLARRDQLGVTHRVNRQIGLHGSNFVETAGGGSGVQVSVPLCVDCDELILWTSVISDIRGNEWVEMSQQT